MPIYEYSCEECGKTFEVLTKSCCTDDKKDCPQCGSDKVKKIFSVFGVGTSGKGGDAHGPACGG